MANQEHLDMLKLGVEVWNKWREEHSFIQPDLSRANLSGANLSEANLFRANLDGADLSEADLNWTILSKANLSGVDLRGKDLWVTNLLGANLSRANLSGLARFPPSLREANLLEANLSNADLSRKNLSETILTGANLSGTILTGANLSGANLSNQDLSNKDLSGADLSGANLSKTTLVGTNLANTKLKDCTIYGIAVWDVQLNGAEQINLTITPVDQPTISVDNLKIAQFIYLLLNNAEIREVIDTITSKVVLILGRFSPVRKGVLDTLRDELRKRNYTPVLFDFEKPASRDLTETVSTLAHMARFVIADITDAKSIPQELQTIVPNLPSVPVLPLILNSQHEYSMFEHFTRFPWVLPVYRYTDEGSLLKSLQKKVIIPAEQKAKKLEKR